MNLKYIDIHSHLNFPEFDNDRKEIISKMLEREIGTITVGTDFETSSSAVELAEKYPNIWATVGIHPTHDADPLLLEEFLSSPKVVGIGECGLDYGKAGIIADEEKEMQKRIFEVQIELASKYNLPIMIHARNSNEDILRILNEKKKIFPNLRGNAHFFSGSIEQAYMYISLDFSVSFTGVITFARDYDEVVRSVPLENIMSETDSPFVSPLSCRGKRNTPLNIIEIVEKIGEIKGLLDNSQDKIILKNAVAKWGLVW